VTVKTNVVRADRNGVSFPNPRVPVCDVEIEGRRIMSMFPAEHHAGPQGRPWVAWPPGLRPYLRGAGRVVVREHVSGVVHFDDEVRWDNSLARVQVVGATGRPLTVSKWGGMARTFDDADDAGELVEMTAELLHDLNDVVGVPAYAAYGTLLGAVRSGRVIGHDTDADVSYLSRFSHPADIATESFRIQRELRRLGWPIDRGRSARLAVRRRRHIDIFVSYFQGDRFSLDQWVEGPLRRDQILPLSTVTLEGQSLPAPADPAAVLALNYGPGWATPDPSFHYDGSLPHLARAKGWFGGHTANKIPWNHYWSLAPKPSDRSPSPFAHWVLERADPAAPLLDLGCGNGSDTIAYARHGIAAIGYDFAGSGLVRARAAASDVSPRPKFVRLSLADGRVILTEGTRLAGLPGPKTVTARLVLDTLPPDGYANFWRFLRLATNHGGTAYLEFRARPRKPLEDSPAHLWQRLVDIEDVRRRIGRIGGVITQHETARSGRQSGLAAPTHRLAIKF
jgi:SAM-dependent methyltransferase